MAKRIADLSHIDKIEDLIPALALHFDQLFSFIDDSNIKKRGISLGNGSGWAGKLDAEFISYTTNATANTEDAISHNLGRVPVGYIVVKNGNGGVIYNGSTAWTNTTIYLKCTTASNPVTILIF